MPVTVRPLRVAIVEDDALLRGLLRRTLEGERAIAVVADCADGAEALRRLPALKPDVALLDIDLGEGPTGIEVARRLRADRPALAVALLSHHRVPRALELLAGAEGDRIPRPSGAGADGAGAGGLAGADGADRRRAGADGAGAVARGGLAYLLKGSVAEVGTVVRALRAAAAGEVALDPALARDRRAHAATPLAALTPRQLDVLRLLAAGWANGAIAARLGLSEKSVENQLNAIYRALAIDGGPDRNRRVTAVLRYLEQSAPSVA